MLRHEDFFTFILKRETIRLRRITPPGEAPQGPPWTDDPILRDYKFTNVRRDHDRTTQKLKEIYLQRSSQVDPPAVQLYNCGVARYFGTWEFYHDVGWQGKHMPHRLKAAEAERRVEGKRVWTGAYVITNQGIKAPKVDVVVDIFLAALWKAAPNIVEHAKLGSFEATLRQLQFVEGFGGSGFMAKEVLLDSMYFPSIWPQGVLDLNTWAPSGPGARRGAARCVGRDDPGGGLSEKETLAVMKDLFALAPRYWPEGLGALTLQDIQFQLCEFDKYERVRLDQGRPRSRFKPTGIPL